jgi:hypothetical protein
LVSHLAPVYEVTNGLDLRKGRSKALPTADADPHNPDPGFLLTHPDPKSCIPLPETDLRTVQFGSKKAYHIDLSKRCQTSMENLRLSKMLFKKRASSSF